MTTPPISAATATVKSETTLGRTSRPVDNGEASPVNPSRIEKKAAPSGLTEPESKASRACLPALLNTST